MKKFFTRIIVMICSSMLLCSGAAIAVSAPAHVEQLTPDAPDYTELTSLTNRVLMQVNELQAYDDSGIDSDVTAADIDWSQAYKIYVDESDVYADYAEQTMTYDEIQQEMEYYVWMLPIMTQDAHLCVTISKGLPLAENNPAREQLTEEQIQQLEADAGKWCPVEIEELDYDKTAEWYEQKITTAYEGSMQRVFIMGGSPKMRSAVAVIEAADDSVDVVPLEEPRLVGQLPITRSRSSVEQPENGTVYSMEDMAAMLQPYVLNPDSEQTGTGGIGTTDTVQSARNHYFVIGILCIAAFVALGISIISIKRRS